MQFAKAVRQGRYLREEITQKELAVAVGVSRATIQAIECGADTKFSTALKIANALGISLDDVHL